MKTFFLFSIAILGGVFFVNINSVQAVAETCTWTASSTSIMGTSANWDKGDGTACTLDSADSLVFDGTRTSTSAVWDNTMIEVASVKTQNSYYGTIQINATNATTTDLFLNSTSTLVNGGSLLISGIATTTIGSTFNNTNTIQIAGNFFNNGTFSDSQGTLTMTGTSKTLGGTGTATFYNLTIGGSVTLTSNITVTHVLTVSATKTLNADTYTLTLSGTGTPLLHAGGTFSNQSGTVSYTGTSANIASTTYSNLSLGTGTYTMLAATTVTGTLTNTGTLSATSTLTLSGAGTPFVNSGTFTANSSTVTYTNTGSVTTAGAPYWILTLGSGTYTFGGNTTSTNSFTNGGLLTIGASYYLYAPTTFDNNGTTTESGIIKHPLTSSKLTDSAGDEVTTFGAGDSVYINVVDSDGNLNVNAVDTITGSVVTASTYSDSETITLTETGVNTSIFRSAALPFSLSTGANNNNAKFDVAGNGTLSLAFTDSKDITDTGSDTSNFLNSNLPSGGSGSGGGSTASDTTPPTNTSVSIANGANSTASVNVTLTLGAVGASQMMINNASDFVGGTWVTYSTTKTWTLTTGDGVKTVYAKFKDTAGNISTAISDTISLNSPVNPVTPVPTTEVVIPVVTTPSPTTNETVTTPTPAPTVSVTHQFTKDLAIKAVGNEVRALQEALRDLGYFKYPSITGYYGTVTMKALQDYQKANGLTPNGKLDSATRSALNGAPAPVVEEMVVTSGYKFISYLYLGSSGTEVRNLQQILKDLGYYNHPTITGYFGPVTKTALIKFQQDKGVIPSPGWVGPGTRAVLNSL